MISLRSKLRARLQASLRACLRACLRQPIAAGSIHGAAAQLENSTSIMHNPDPNSPFNSILGVLSYELVTLEANLISF